jgi:hypothetical protein
MILENWQDPHTTRAATIDEVTRELARQDEALARASEQLAALGGGALSVPRAALEAIDAACVVTTTLTSAALRG